MGPRIIFACLTLFILAVIAFSCSHGSKFATMPDPNQETSPVSQYTGDLGSSGDGTMGTFDVALDRNSMTINMVPQRKSQEIGDSQALEIDQYLQSDPCSDCLKVTDLSLDVNNRVVMDVGIKHPFAAGGSRLDLDVFDVRLIIIVQGSEQFSLTMRDGVAIFGNFSFIANADGFTPYFDDGPNGPYPGILNPFIDFFIEDNPAWDVVGEEIPNHRMAMGADYDYKRLVLNIPSGGTYTFRMLVEASYGQSAKRSLQAGTPGSRTNPQYYIPEFNRKEVYSLKARADQMIYGSNPAVIVDLEALDWQADAHVGSAFPGNLGDLVAPSGVQDVSLEVPLLAFYGTDPYSTTGTGTSDDPMHVKFKVPMSAMSVYPFLAAVRDERDMSNDELDISAYKYGQIDTFIQTGPNTVINKVYTSEYDSVLGRRSIATDGDFVYITWTDIESQHGMVYCARSCDAGETFTPRVRVNDTNHEDTKMKPSIAIDDSHAVYIVWEDYGNLNPFSDAPDIIMAKSTNNGSSFNPNIQVNDVEDVADDSQFSPTICTKGSGNLYVSWIEKPTGTNCKHVRLARSIDGGSHFLPEVIVSAEIPRTGDPTLGVNDNSIVWIAWRDYRNQNQDIFASRSTNNGANFSSPIKINDDPGSEYQSAPTLVVDKDGVAYIAWEDSRDPGRNDFDIYFAYSTSSTTFSANKRINRIQNVAFTPNIAMTPDGGIYVIYQDRRDDASGDIYVTGSLDKGKTFTIDHDVKINDDSTPSIQICPQIAIGDDGTLHFAWGDGRGLNPRIFYAKSIFP